MNNVILSLEIIDSEINSILYNTEEMASNLNLFERDSSYKLNVYENAEVIRKIV